MTDHLDKAESALMSATLTDTEALRVACFEMIAHARSQTPRAEERPACRHCGAPLTPEHAAAGFKACPDCFDAPRGPGPHAAVLEMVTGEPKPSEPVADYMPRGTWRCNNCGSKKRDGESPDSSWRCTSERWQHKCPGEHPMVGYFGAELVEEPVAEVSDETVLAIVNANSGHGPIDIDDAMRIARAGVLHGRASRDVEVELFLKATEDREQERGEARKEATDLLTTVDQLRAELAERERQIFDLSVERDKYHELLRQVGNVFPGETRHETALRYLWAAESNAGSGTVIPAELRTEGKGVT